MTRHVLRPAVWLFAAVAVAACVGPPAPVGTIAVALTALGPNGSIYRLPPAVLLLDNAGYHAVISLDADAPSTTFDVPVGDYAVSAFALAGDDPWPLTREDPDGTTETLLAALEPLPAISVTQDHTTPLLLRFHIPSLEPITFSLGSVEVFVAVDGAHASSVDFAISAPSMDTSPFCTNLAPMALPPRFATSGGVVDSYAVTAHVTGPWSIASPFRVCAPVFAFASAGGRPGLVNLVAEVPTAELLCIERGDHVTIVSVSFRREGGAQTPLLSDLGPQPFVITHTAGAIIHDPDVFDGRILHLERLLGTESADVGMNGEIGVAAGTLPGGITLTNRWCVLNGFSGFGNGTLALIAQ